MKKYKNIILKKISTALNIAYITTVVLWSTATFSFSLQRQDLKEDYKNNELTREEYLEKCKEFSQKEEGVFKTLTATLMGTFATDCVVSFVENEQE